MIKEISNIVDSALPAINMASVAASIFMGRKFALAVGYRMSGVIASLMHQPNAAEEWNKTSHDYWTRAKKDGIRDLTALGGFIALGVVSSSTGKALKKEEPIWFDNTPILSNILAMIGLGGGVGLSTWYALNKLVPNTDISHILKLAIEKGVLTQEQKIDLIFRTGGISF